MGWMLLALFMTFSHVTDATKDGMIFSGKPYSSGRWHVVKWTNITTLLISGGISYDLIHKSPHKFRTFAKVVSLWAATNLVWRPVYSKISRGRWFGFIQEGMDNAIPTPLGGVRLQGRKMTIVWILPSAIGFSLFIKL